MAWVVLKSRPWVGCCSSGCGCEGAEGRRAVATTRAKRLAGFDEVWGDGCEIGIASSALMVFECVYHRSYE